jgi:RES domain-containing protein
MILIALERETAYRMHTPKWAVAPMSGAGAARWGGRANRPGVEALYLSLDTETAIREYKQLSPLLPPGTLVSYQVTAHPIVDFRQGYHRNTWDPLWDSFHCDWRELWFNQHIEPPSWVIGDQVIAAGAKGILFRSQISNGGVNLVLYPGSFGKPDLLEVIDPRQALPKNQDSWA